MNRIKKIIHYALYILLFAVYSCTTETNGTNGINETNEISSDFKIQNINWQYQVLTYKGHEYLCNTYVGGIIHTESCECRNSD